jgi:flagellar basal body-associated protein FliL
VPSTRFERFRGRETAFHRRRRSRMGILWIILIVILVLALLGFFSRGRW